MGSADGVGTWFNSWLLASFIVAVAKLGNLILHTAYVVWWYFGSLPCVPLMSISISISVSAHYTIKSLASYDCYDLFILSIVE